MPSLLRQLAVRSARRLHRGLRHRIIPSLAAATGWRSPHQTVFRWPEGPIPVGPRPCVFAHWDGAGEVRPHVLHYLRELGAAGLSVLFVSNAGSLRPEALAAVQALCSGVLIRRNVGYDFGAWREGFEALGLPRPGTELAVMANDSVYGPLSPLSDVLARVDLARADVWGCTETWQSRYHLQSYFLAFAPRVLASRSWAEFWGGVRPVPNKDYVIQTYEIGLSQALIRAGFTCRALWDYPALVNDIDPALLVTGEASGLDHPDPRQGVREAHARRLRQDAVSRVALNPTSDLWRQLLRARFPFIKRELLRDNPTRIPDLVDWRDILRDMGADATLIERDLQRSLRGAAP